MKPAKDAFAAAIERAEKSLRRRNRGPTIETPQERGHAVTKLSEERVKRRKDEARQIVQQVRRLGLDAETLAKIDAAAKAHAQSFENWIFVMLSPAQNAEVVRWINRSSKRPQKASELWATLLERLRMDTGEIMATRQELAERVGETPQNLSRIMTELASINAIRREKEGRKVRYFLNPSIATHVPNPAKRKAARDEAGPLLKLMEGGRP
jgi:DNA-binding transcriptional ArsR family regulator